MINQVDADVVVVGAGLCGLTAARTLRAAGVEVIVLEATEEVGGRARTRQVGGLVANLGGEWVGSHHRRMRRLAAEHRLELKPTRFLGSRVRWRTEHHDTIGRIPPLTRRTAAALAGAFWQAGRLARGLSVDAPWCSPQAEALDRISFGAWLRERGVVDDAYELMDTFIGDLVSMPIADLSLLHVLWWVRRNDGPITAARSAFEARLINGSQELAHRMAMPLRDCIRLGAPVSRVEQNADTVSLGLTEGGELRARRAILALPATRLTNLAFDPALDHANQRLSQELRIGAATKVAAALPSAKSDLPRTVLGGHPLTACWRYGRQITGFARPPYDELPDDTLITELAHAFSATAEDLRDVTVIRWIRERHIGGCDVGFQPGQLSELGPLLKSSHQLVRFAGPERSSWPNNMEGAIESGEHAATETLHSRSRAAARRRSRP